ncbi:MAG TPA: DUF1326 domain-containing protein [Kiloniellales bacterium]|nr:DUF1326 domain-containing protein [Kiloniellales bacterium]
MASWRVEGKYMEACNCETVCPCIFFSPPTEGQCTAFIVWEVDKGNRGDVRLDGLRAALLAHAKGNMKNGNWQVALYVDERANDAQREALSAIFSGGAGGHLSALGPLIGEVLGVRPAKISVMRSGKQTSFSVAGVADTAIAPIEGQGGGPVTVSGHPLAVVPGVPFLVHRSERLAVKDYSLACAVEGRSGFTAPFVYEA